MGLVSDESGVKSTFSDDVLRLEISGPNEDHLSVIDVPGIFKRTTSGVTTKSDMEMVEGMVHNYMKNPRCVMLAVVPANVNPGDTRESRRDGSGGHQNAGSTDEAGPGG